MYSSLIFLSLITRVSELRLAVTGIPSFITLEQSLCPPRPPLTMRLTLQGAFQKRVCWHASAQRHFFRLHVGFNCISHLIVGIITK